MKTLKEVLEQKEQYAKLINSILTKIDIEDFEDVYNNGAEVGFNGFIYYKDTMEFFNENKEDILNLLKETSLNIGLDEFELIRNFNYLKDYNLTNIEIAEAIYNENSTLDVKDNIINCLSWFALEEVARWFCETEEEEIL